MSDDDGAPACEGCDNILTHVDHYGIERYVFDPALGSEGVYREVTGEEGLASEIDLRCRYCGTSLSREARVFFYERWCRVLALTERMNP